LWNWQDAGRLLTFISSHADLPRSIHFIASFRLYLSFPFDDWHQRIDSLVVYLEPVPLRLMLTMLAAVMIIAVSCQIS
jgi:hypothetical protein